MKKLKLSSKPVLILVSIISIFIGMFFSAISFYQGYHFAYAQSTLKDDPSVQNAMNTQKAFSLIAKSVIPSVVNISSEIRVKQQQQFSQNDPFFQYFGKDWFDFFFQNVPKDLVEQALGSGVIVDADGFILTNYHVVKDATQIKVKLNNGKEYKAKVVGIDAKTDLALIKIDTGEKLPVAPIGDSDKIEIGFWAIAIGNPFGLNQTFTVGVISAKGRTGVLEDNSRYENFIQTDAPINPGNSGGPLVNIQGEVIGINTAIATPSGGNVGIGFAVPINMAKMVMEQLKEHGKVVRGWLGVSIQDLTPNLAKLFKREADSGVLVSEVFKNTPGEKAGLKSGDIIIKYNENEIKDTAALKNNVEETKPGSIVKLTIIRKNAEMTLDIKIGEMPQPNGQVQAPKPLNTWLGLKVEGITPEIAKQYQLQDEQGVVISSIEQGSAALEQGLKPGDIIKQINDTVIKDINDFENFINQNKDEKSFLLIIKRDNRLFYLAIENQ